MKTPLIGAGLLALALLSGCSAVAPITTVTATSAYTATGSLTSASYDAVSDTLTITGMPFDNGELDATYVRSAALDTNGFKAYVNTNGQRNYVALWGVSTAGTGAMGAGVVATGDYYTNGFSGATYGRDDTTSVPTSGLATYTGRYAGLLTYGAGGGLDRTSGDVTIDVDFTDSKVEGVIFNRQNITTATAQDNLSLGTASLITGAFTGDATSYNAGVVVESGSYEGIIGGSTGLEVAGIVIITAGGGLTATLETGAFVSDSVVLLPTP